MGSSEFGLSRRYLRVRSRCSSTVRLDLADEMSSVGSNLAPPFCLSRTYTKREEE